MFKKIALGMLGLLLIWLGLCNRSASLVVKADATQFNSPLPTPFVSFYYTPSDPSTYDNINFGSNSYDPLGQAIQSWAWDFGDGAKAIGGYATHQYKANGDYTVRHTVTTTDARRGVATYVVSVRTHDVAITKFARPKDGRVGDVRTLVIGISNKLQAETVHVELYKSAPGTYDGFTLIGFSEQYVPVQKNGKTTDFLFGYTFTPTDGQIGKVNFKAIAWLINARDAWLADNAYITQSTIVRPSKSAALNIQAMESTEEVDDVANGTAIPTNLPDNVQNYRAYLPFVKNQ